MCTINLFMIVQQCIDCNKTLNNRRNVLRCHKCAAILNGINRRKEKTKCIDCGSYLNNKRSKRCRDCYNLYMVVCPPNPNGAGSGENSPSFKGGKYFDKRGYVYILSTSHPNKNSRGYVFEHRIVMEKHLKRFLKKGEVIHHINGIKHDNRIDNLKLFENHSKHIKTHHPITKYLG